MYVGPDIVTDGLVLAVDAGSTRSIQDQELLGQLNGKLYWNFN